MGIMDEDELRRLETLANWLDGRFHIPGTKIRFGLDALVGLVPGVGDLLMTLPSGYIILRALNTGAGVGLAAVMVLNVLFDMAIGVVPLLGDLLDVAFKANIRNAELLRRHIERQQKRALENRE